MSQVVVEFEQVFKRYPMGGQQVEALRGLDLAIAEPGYYAIMGASGSGKSTLLHLLAGLDRADAGRVAVDGEDLGQLSERKLTTYRRRRIGIVFQKYNLIPTLTARQNIALPGVIDRRARPWINERTQQLLDELGLSERAEHRPEALSGGEQQRVAIGRALLFNPPLLLADEPTGNLDSNNAERLWRLLASIAERQGMTVVMVTHEPAAAVHCQKVFVLGDGVCRGSFEVHGLDAGSLATRYQQLSR